MMTIKPDHSIIAHPSQVHTAGLLTLDRARKWGMEPTGWVTSSSVVASILDQGITIAEYKVKPPKPTPIYKRVWEFLFGGRRPSFYFCGFPGYVEIYAANICLLECTRFGVKDYLGFAIDPEYTNLPDGLLRRVG